MSRYQSVALVVPWRGGDPDRERAWTWLAEWWVKSYPDWDLVMGQHPEGPWCKATAVADGLSRTDAQVLVVADADVYVPAVGRAVQMVLAGAVTWAMPHKRVYRLTADGTDHLIITGRPPPPTRADPPRGTAPSAPPLIAESHRGEIGGGCVILPAHLYQQVPLDPRFVGWGQEDTSWGRALTVMAGPPWRESDPLWHLWHPPPRRAARGETPELGEYARRDRAVGNLAGLALYRRYRAATTPAAMAALLGEFRPA